MEFLYKDESVKRACKYVDTQRKAINWTFDSLMDVTRTAIKMVKVDNHKKRRFVYDIFFYTVDEFLKIEYLAEGGRSHDPYV